MKALVIASGEDDAYKAIRKALDSKDPTFANEIKKQWGLPLDYKTGRLEVHHKNFLKGTTPYFYKIKNGKLVMRSQKEINYMVKKLKERGFDLGNTKANMTILPKELHIKDLPGALSTHSIFKGFFDFQGGGSEDEFVELMETTNLRSKPVTLGQQKGVSVQGETPFSTRFRQIGGSQIGMSEDEFRKILDINDIDELVDSMSLKLEAEVPKSRASIAAAAYLSDAPEKTKKAVIKEFAGTKGQDLDELIDVMQSSMGARQRYLEDAQKLIDQGIDPETKLPYKRKDLNKERQLYNERLQGIQRIQEKIGPTSKPEQRRMGFHRRDSPYLPKKQRAISKGLRKIASKFTNQLGTSTLGIIPLASIGLTEAGLSQTLEEYEANPNAINAAQTWLARGELAGEGLSAAGAGASATGIGAIAGVPMMLTGEALSQVAGWADVGLEAVQHREEIWDAVTDKENQEWFLKKATQAKTYRDLGVSAVKGVYNAPGNIVGYYQDRLGEEEEEDAPSAIY